jgi:hypothetical protein
MACSSSARLCASSAYLSVVCEQRLNLTYSSLSLFTQSLLLHESKLWLSSSREGDVIVSYPILHIFSELVNCQSRLSDCKGIYKDNHILAYILPTDLLEFFQQSAYMIRRKPDRTMKLDERRLFRISLSFSYMPDDRTHFPGFQAQLHADLAIMSSESDSYPTTFQLSAPSSLDRSYIDTIILTILALLTSSS